MGEIIRRRELLGDSLPKKAFSECTWEEINDICEAGKAQEYVDNGTWTIGDVNTNATYGSYSGVQLMHVLTESQRATYKTSAHIIVQFVNTLVNTSWNGSAGTLASYSSASIFSVLNETIFNGLNSDFKSVLKQFSPPTSVQNSSSGQSTTDVEYPTGYLHLPNCKEIGETNYYRPSENSVSFTFKYYADGGSKSKSGASNYYWYLRSPAHYNGFDYYLVYWWNMLSSTMNDEKQSDRGGIPPIACI